MVSSWDHLPWITDVDSSFLQRHSHHFHTQGIRHFVENKTERRGRDQ